MRPKTLLVLVALVVALLVSAPQTFAQNLVTNGSFESGDLSGWGGDQLGVGVETGAFYQYSGAQDGQFYAIFGAVGSDGSISQTIADTAGAQYTFSFWFNAVGDNPSDFSASWDGTQLLSLTNPTTGGVWTQFTFQVTGTGSDTITFAGRDDPAWMALDNVSLTQNSTTGTTPEPSSFLLMGSGVLALGGAIRRKLAR
jgi:PEP-CTERM motif